MNETREGGFILKRSLINSLASAGLMLTAAPAIASTIVAGRCDSLTDGDAQGCVFSGNINGNLDPTNKNSFGNAQAAYNAAFNPDIILNFLTTLDGFGDVKTGTFDFSQQFAGFTIDFIAVKGGNEFILLQNPGGGLSGSFSTAGLLNGGRNQPAISHVSFFGNGGAVPAVPEPTTWAFMLIGFGAVGYSMRKRSRNGSSSGVMQAV